MSELILAQQIIVAYGEIMQQLATICNIQLQTAISMSSNIRIEKTCQFCHEQFIAKTTVTKYCGDRCAKRAYKKRKRDEKIKATINEKPETFTPILKEKEFLSIKETSSLLGVSRWTIHRLIKNGLLPSKKLGRRVIIKKQDIKKLLS